jgi:signal transduction histidine kinase
MESVLYRFQVVPPFWRTWWFIGLLVLALGLGIYAWIHNLRSHIRSQKILTYFATSLYGQNTVDDVFWDIARNCISQLQFEDCVIYQADEDRQLLVQRAAFGPKSPKEHELLNPMEIPLGTGIVGHVAASGKAEIVKDTSRDKRYIVDDNKRNSEMAVPIMVDGKVFGVIDSEHSRKGFYTRRHLHILTRIAEIAAAKISKYLIEERIRLKIARDLHDEMGSTLTSINIISKMAIGQVGDNTDLTQQLEKIKEHSARMMDSMSDIVWAINPSNDSFEKVILRMKEFAAEILEPAGINYFFREEPQIAAVPLSVEKRKELYMLFKEAITNAAKYSGATEISISFRMERDSIALTIMDNGRGFDTQQVMQGNGLRNMRNRAAQMKADLRIDSITDTGTSIHVLVPIT